MTINIKRLDILPFMPIILGLVLSAGCAEDVSRIKLSGFDTSSGTDTYTDNYTDTFTDNYTDTFTDNNTDTDSYTNTDLPIDTSDTDADTNYDTGNTDTGTEKDSDTDTNYDTADTDTDTNYDTGNTDTDTTGIDHVLPITFDKDLEDLAISWSDPITLAAASSLTHDMTHGYPAAGAARIEIPFTGPNQKVQASVALDSPLDLTGKTIKVRILLASGLTSDTSAPGGVKIYLKSGGSYIYADGGWHNMSSGDGWIEISINASNPSGYIDNASYDASDIRELGVEFDTNSTTASSYETAVIFIDSFTY